MDTSTTQTRRSRASPRPGLKISIESLNARYRRAVNAKATSPPGPTRSGEQAVMKTLYLVTRSLDLKGLGQARWVTRWKPALNAFAVTFADRMPAGENL